MRKSEIIVIGGVLGLIAYFGFRTYSALSSLVFTPGNILSVELQGMVPVFTITVLAQNTSNTDLRVNSFAGNLFSNNTLVGNVSSFTPAIIPANSTVQIPIQIQLGLIGLANDLITAFQTKNFQQAIQVQGFANVSGIQVPLKLDYTVGA